MVPIISHCLNAEVYVKYILFEKGTGVKGKRRHTQQTMNENFPVRSVLAKLCIQSIFIVKIGFDFYFHANAFEALIWPKKEAPRADFFIIREGFSSKMQKEI